ncbi:hypothetical protein AB4520_16170 [Vibrio renipiscarius]|uniref:hypothetical protein n=1 Tax=Vibrio renipiscarius TaxID=1461322 RepID=UPI00354C2825
MKSLLAILLTTLVAFSASTHASSRDATELGPMVNCTLSDNSVVNIPSGLCRIKGGKYW